MDAIDNKLIHHLMGNGRATWLELGNLVGLSAPAVAERVRRLEENGVITGYAAMVEPEKLGLGILALISVSIDHPANREGFLRKIQELDIIQECYHIAGDEDYLLKVYVTGIRQLEALVSDTIKELPGVIRTKTRIVLSTVKDVNTLPLPYST